MQLRAVVFKNEQGQWIAVCLDHYMVTYADSEAEIEAAIAQMLLTEWVAAGEAGEEPFSGFPPAPQRYQDMWNELGSQREVRAPEGMAVPHLVLRSTPHAA